MTRMRDGKVVAPRCTRACWAHREPEDHKRPEGMLRPSFVSPRRKEGPPCIWDTHGISGNVFANPHASSSAPYPQDLNPWCTTN